LFGFVAGAEEEGADAEAVEAGGGGDFCVVHAFDVGEPEELALAGLEVLEHGTDVYGVVEGGVGAGLGRVGVRGGVACAPTVAEEVGGDAEEVAAELEGIEAGGCFGVEEQAAEGFLQEVVGYIAAVGDGEEVAVDRGGVGVVEALKGQLAEDVGRGGGGVVERAGHGVAAGINRAIHC
jgi:hypothetical protein